MSTHTQQTKKRRPYLFICILILLIALAGIFVQRFEGQIYTTRHHCLPLILVMKMKQMENGA